MRSRMTFLVLLQLQLCGLLFIPAAAAPKHAVIDTMVTWLPPSAVAETSIQSAYASKGRNVPRQESFVATDVSPSTAPLPPFNKIPSMTYDEGIPIVRGVSHFASDIETFLRGRQPPTRLRIPSLAVDAAVQPVGLDEAGGIAVLSDPWVVYWYNGSAFPGQDGVVVLAGHLDTRDGRPAVFARLRTLVAGEILVVTTANGQTLLYRVRTTLLVPYGQLPTELWDPAAPPQIALITCAGSWQPAANRYSHNLIVLGDWCAECVE